MSRRPKHFKQPHRMARSLELLWLGRVSYGPALALQRSLVDARRSPPSSSSPSPARAPASFDTDVVLALEHPPTYTVGRRTTGDDVEGERLRALGADYFEVRRRCGGARGGEGREENEGLERVERREEGVERRVEGLERRVEDEDEDEVGRGRGGTSTQSGGAGQEEERVRRRRR